MLKKMLGIDPAEIKSQIEQLVQAAQGLHREQQRIAEFQNVLAQHMLKIKEDLTIIETHRVASQEANEARHDILHHDVANLASAFSIMLENWDKLIEARKPILEGADDA